MSRRSRHVLIRCGIIALLLLTVFATPIAALAATNATISERLNLRSGPGLGYHILTVMPAGAIVVVTGEPTEGWYPVQYDDLIGWAFGQYIVVGGGSDTPVADSGTHDTAIVVTSQLNLRSGPGLGYSVVARLDYGTTVELLGGQQRADGYDWAEVLTKAQQHGWVAAAYLDPGESGGTSDESADDPQPAAAPAAPASSGNPIIDLITEAANKYGQNPEAMLAVARCESGLNPAAYNARSGASGLFQFLPGTWRTTPFASYSIFDAWASANAAGWMWSQGRRGEWYC